MIGYSDAFMLDLPIYSALRIAGFDPFVSFEWLLILLTIVGFVGFYLVMRLLLRVNNALLAAAGAAVATMPSNFVLEAIGLGHAQQFAQHFLVWAALLSVLPLVRKDLFVSRVCARALVRRRWWPAVRTDIRNRILPDVVFCFLLLDRYRRGACHPMAARKVILGKQQMY